MEDVFNYMTKTEAHEPYELIKDSIRYCTNMTNIDI